MVPLLYAFVIYGMAWFTGLAGFRLPTLAYQMQNYGQHNADIKTIH